MKYTVLVHRRKELIAVGVERRRSLPQPAIGEALSQWEQKQFRLPEYPKAATCRLKMFQLHYFANRMKTGPILFERLFQETTLRAKDRLEFIGEIVYDVKAVYVS